MAAGHQAQLAYENGTALHTRPLSDLVSEYEERAIELAGAENLYGLTVFSSRAIDGTSEGLRQRGRLIT